ncbi:DUF2490 domain-containing protein [Sphingomonas sp. M1-B02]|uniref:DUF2490 domain-containing protein n=1 Tax=Sphingomonas sp. M1-B02 TaxID=3114300 RepID=UPI002240A1C7|nr:DUF2490 domain-containing protein [Sphingomonas sp. S6-11]UZK64708.1 DUF2490 domain-containing protein [Sphingomonas sp. S6-11]
MTGMLRVLGLAFALLVALPAAAQQVDEQLWFQANGITDLDQDTTIMLESIGRFYDKVGGFAHSEFGGIVTHTLSDSVEVAFGFRHVQDYDRGRPLPNFERFRQTITFTLAPGLTTRTRIEETFSSDGPGMGVRARQQLRYEHAIGGGVDAFAAHESFLLVNDTGWGQQSGYDRMRHTIGLQIPLGEQLSGEVSYLNQYSFGRDGDRDEMDHIAVFALTLSL